jgi:hypothetical protein
MVGPLLRHFGTFEIGQRGMLLAENPHDALLVGVAIYIP